MKKYLLLAVTLLLICLPATAQPNKVAFGDAHGENDFVINWKQYYTYDQIADIMHKLAKQYSDICKIESIGKSRMGRDQWVLTITNFKTGKDTDKPAIWVDGAIHGNEVNGSMDALYLAWYVLTRYKYDPDVYETVNRTTLYILPMFNVDANDSYLRFPNSENNPREPFRPVDDDKDGLFDEDMTEDVDGDGELSTMYIEDPSGNYRISDDGFRFVTIPAGTVWEGKRYRSLGSEGYDNDGDGRMADDDLGGIDPNRLFPFDFRKSMGKTYPLSEPVVRNMWNFVYPRKNILVDFNYHNVGREVMFQYPPAAAVQRVANTRYPAAPVVSDKFTFQRPYDVDAAYQHDADVMAKFVTNALYTLKDYHQIPANEYGETPSSMYYLKGVYSVLIELYDGNSPYADTDGDNRVTTDEYIRWVKNDLGEDAWVKPHEFDHPQFGKIMIGGTYKKHIGRTPPPRYIEDEAYRQSRLVFNMLRELPKLELKNPVVNKVANGVYQVDIDVVNDKIFPTASDRAIMMKQNTPDVLTVSVTGGTLIEPASSSMAATTTSYAGGISKSAISVGSRAEFRTRGNSVTTYRYTVTSNNPGNTTLTINLDSKMGGSSSLKVKLQ
ncbi:MAG: hypothetical protein J6Z27_03295 [Bacteroidales bacterium]|nr:hypothetical protein [Bacteroidales bacterium]